MSQISLPSQRGLVAVKFVWRYSIARPRKTLLYAKISWISLIQAELYRILSQISLPWQRGLVAVKFFWRHSLALPGNPPVGRKVLVDISYIGGVMADFVPNFVAMATGVGRSKICLASFNSPTRKTPCYTQRSRGYLLYRPSYTGFCPKFRCHGNGGSLQ